MIQPGDKVRITKQRKRRDATSPEVLRGIHTVLAVYPRFVLVQTKHWRECFFLDEVETVEKRGRAAA